MSPRPLVLGAAALALAAAVVVPARSASAAPDPQSYLPLAEGNAWTYARSHPLRRLTPLTISVDARFTTGIYHLSTFPGLGDSGGMWVGFAGDTLYAWNPEARGWVAFLDFGARSGSAWRVDLGLDGFRGTTIRLETRSARVTVDAVGKTFTSCIGFTFRRAGQRDEERYFFAPLAGLVSWSDPGRTGTLDASLLEASVFGRPLGTIASTRIEQGATSGYDSGDDPRVRVFNSPRSWAGFYRVHAPGALAPAIDFDRQTVVAVLAGERRGGGYSVLLERVTWNFPYTSVQVHAVELEPARAATSGTTRPFDIVVLDRKVSRAYLRYRVEPAAPTLPPPPAGTPQERFADDLRAWLVGYYRDHGSDIVASGGNDLAAAQAAVDARLVEEVTEPDEDPFAHDLGRFRVFRHPDVTFPGSDIVLFGAYDRATGALVEIYDFN